jgi:IclR family pca regulon transcriptional regulator
MGGLAKGLAIIEALTTHGVLSVSDAARASNITRAAARRCLITLTELAEPLLARARDELAESVSLAVLDNDTSLFIARAEAEHIVSTGVRVGAHLPAYCSATGRVLLSQFSDDEIVERIGRKPLRSRTPHTITKIPPLVNEIRAVRKRAYAISDEELELGMRSLAVPVIIGENHEIIAAISVSAASARVRVADLRHHFLPILQSCSKSLSQRISNAH